MSLNKVIIQGRFSKTPELGTVGDGIPFLQFPLAVDSNYSKGGNRETYWINCKAFRKTAEFIAAYFDKGSQIIIDGELQTRSYTAQDGSKRTATEIMVGSAYFSGSKASAAPAATSDQFTEVSDDERLPF